MTLFSSCITLRLTNYNLTLLTLTQRERGLGVRVALGAMLPAERDQNVHGHVSYEIVECVSLPGSESRLLMFGKRRNPFPVRRWVLCRIWIWSWISVNRAGKSSRNIGSLIERLVGKLRGKLLLHKCWHLTRNGLKSEQF